MKVFLISGKAWNGKDTTANILTNKCIKDNKNVSIKV